MASWQYDLYLLPRKNLSKSALMATLNIRQELLDSLISWQNTEMPNDYQLFLDSCLQRYKSWDNTSLSWGSEEGNFINISFCGDKIEEVIVRLDMRNFDSGLLEKIIFFSKWCDCVMLLMEWMEIIEPEYQLIIDRIRQSKAALFVYNPQQYFEQVKKEKQLN